MKSLATAAAVLMPMGAAPEGVICTPSSRVSSSRTSLKRR